MNSIGNLRNDEKDENHSHNGDDLFEVVVVVAVVVRKTTDRSHCIIVSIMVRYLISISTFMKAPDYSMW